MSADHIKIPRDSFFELLSQLKTQCPVHDITIVQIHRNAAMAIAALSGMLARTEPSVSAELGALVGLSPLAATNTLDVTIPVAAQSPAVDGQRVAL